MRPCSLFHEDCGETSYVGAGKLRDKVAIITGGDSGIGRAVAIAFAREGADVAIVYAHHDEDAAEVRELVLAAGRRCLLIKADVSRREDCEAAVERVIAEWGRLDTLVNNAGIQFEETSLDDAIDNLERIFATNVYSSFYLAAAALRHFKPHTGCTIIENTSINAFAGNDHLISYTATKGAMQAFTRSVAKMLKDKGIRCNAVAPGPIWTPFITGTMPADKCAEFGASNPTGRAGQPAECAGAFVFLASGDSSFVNGATIHVDGGQYTSS